MVEGGNDGHVTASAYPVHGLSLEGENVHHHHSLSSSLSCTLSIDSAAADSECKIGSEPHRSTDDGIAHAYSIVIPCGTTCPESMGSSPVAITSEIIDIPDIDFAPSNVSVEHQEWLRRNVYREARSWGMSVGLLLMGTVAMGFDIWCLVFPWLTRVDPVTQQETTYYLLSTHGPGADCSRAMSHCKDLRIARHSAAAFTILSLLSGVVFCIISIAKCMKKVLLPRPGPQIISVGWLAFKAFAVGLWTGYISKYHDEFCGGDICTQEYGSTGAWAGLLLSAFLAVACVFARENRRMTRKPFLRGPLDFTARQREILLMNRFATTQ